MKRSTWLLLGVLLGAAFMIFSSGRKVAEGPLVLVASSMTEAMSEAAAAWQAQGHAPPILSFAGTPALARQIEAGATADLLVSADDKWVSDLVAKKLLDPASVANLASNRLVLIAKSEDAVQINLTKGVNLGAVLGEGKLALADPASVPAGRYAEAALRALDAWPGVEGKIARTENVRAALALVERGAARFAVVYATDVRASKVVKELAGFPSEAHPPIHYPIARLIRSPRPDAAGFRTFLLSPSGKAIFKRHGFIVD